MLPCLQITTKHFKVLNKTIYTVYPLSIHNISFCYVTAFNFCLKILQIILHNDKVNKSLPEILASLFQSKIKKQKQTIISHNL